MCLSGLPTYPTYSVPIGLALWCSIMATTSNLSLIKNPKNDPIRLHLSYASDMIELLDIIGVSVPSKLLEHINEFANEFEKYLKEINLFELLYSFIKDVKIKYVN